MKSSVIISASVLDAVRKKTDRKTDKHAENPTHATAG